MLKNLVYCQKAAYSRQYLLDRLPRKLEEARGKPGASHQKATQHRRITGGPGPKTAESDSSSPDSTKNHPTKHPKEAKSKHKHKDTNTQRKAAENQRKTRKSAVGDGRRKNKKETSFFEGGGGEVGFLGSGGGGVVGVGVVVFFIIIFRKKKRSQRDLQHLSLQQFFCCQSVLHVERCTSYSV